MLPLAKDGKHSIVWNYHRSITRPSFMQLNPFRFQTTEYFYVSGNPKLQPALTDDGSVSLNLFYRYNLTAGLNDSGVLTISTTKSEGEAMPDFPISEINTWYYW